jgi:hypothetical protein
MQKLLSQNRVGEFESFVVAKCGSIGGVKIEIGQMIQRSNSDDQSGDYHLFSVEGGSSIQVLTGVTREDLISCCIVED